MTYRHPEMIVSLAKAIGCKKYLELGIYSGETFKLVSSVVPDCIGVDFAPKVQIANVLSLTTDVFFAQNKQSFDMIFIDAEHSFQQVKKDFHNSINCLNPNGIIILHDTDPENEELLKPGFCNDSYKMIEYIRSIGGFDILTLPIAEAGLSIVSRQENRRALVFIK